MGLIRDIRALWRIKQARDRFREEVEMSGATKAAWGALLVIVPVAVTYIRAACPPLFQIQTGIAVIGAVVSVILLRRPSSGLPASTAIGVGTAGVLALAYRELLTQIGSLCGTTFIEQLPAIVTTALGLGIAAYLRGKPAVVSR